MRKNNDRQLDHQKCFQAYRETKDSSQYQQSYVGEVYILFTIRGSYLCVLSGS